VQTAATVVSAAALITFVSFSVSDHGGSEQEYIKHNSTMGATIGHCVAWCCVLYKFASEEETSLQLLQRSRLRQYDKYSMLSTPSNRALFIATLTTP
jgi:hypothetical protein